MIYIYVLCTVLTSKQASIVEFYKYRDILFLLNEVCKVYEIKTLKMFCIIYFYSLKCVIVYFVRNIFVH